jgi:hypothetical protein
LLEPAQGRQQQRQKKKNRLGGDISAQRLLEELANAFLYWNGTHLALSLERETILK